MIVSGPREFERLHCRCREFSCSLPTVALAHAPLSSWVAALGLIEAHSVAPSVCPERTKMNVSVLEAGFLWRVRVLQGPGTVLQHATKHHIGFVRGAGEISKPPAVSLAVTAMSIPPLSTGQL